MNKIDIRNVLLRDNPNNVIVRTLVQEMMLRDDLPDVEAVAMIVGHFVRAQENFLALELERMQYAPPQIWTYSGTNEDRDDIRKMLREMLGKNQSMAVLPRGTMEQLTKHSCGFYYGPGSNYCGGCGAVVNLFCSQRAVDAKPPIVPSSFVKVGLSKQAIEMMNELQAMRAAMGLPPTAHVLRDHECVCQVCALKNNSPKDDDDTDTDTPVPVLMPKELQ